MADAPKIHIDSDWKVEAQKEKERLAEKEREKSTTGSANGDREALPPADFRTLVGMLAQQAIMGLGVMADKKTGGIIVDLEGSRFSIDLLDVLEQKTKGNLTDDEARELKQILADLRSRFVQIADLISQQMAKQGAGGVAIAPAKAMPTTAATSPIITE